VVPDEQLSLAIGRRGQNVRLASQLTGWDIDILTEHEESERRQKEFQERSTLFITALDVDEMVGQLLASEGFTSIEEIAFVEPEEIASIEGFDEVTAGELQTRASEYLEKLDAELDIERKSLGVADALKEIPGMTTGMLVALGRNDIKTMEDFAGAVPDELTGYAERKEGETTHHPGALDKFGLSRAEAEAMIMDARVRAGWITAEDLVTPPAAEADAAAPADAEAHPAA
jgi:N utilization substance protein A